MSDPKFASSKTFAAHWQNGYSLDELLSGKTADHDFGNADRRQDRLIGKTIDASIATALFSYLRWDHAPETLPAHFFNFSAARSEPRTREAFNAEIRQIQEATRGDRKERERQMFDYVVDLARRGRRGPLATHRSLVGNSQWDAYTRRRAEARELWDAFPDIYEEMKARGKLDEVILPSPVPVDPRLIACNTNIQQWIEIKSSGSKTQESIRSKIERKGMIGGMCNPAVDIRDINRIMVLPDTPRTAEAFFTMLERIAQPVRKSDHASLSHIEPWGVKHWGQFDRMGYLVIARNSGAANGVDRGMIGEIKVVGKEMLVADEMTVPIYTTMRAMEEVSQFIPDSSNPRTNAQITERQAEFAELVQRQQREFDRLRQKHGGKMAEFSFPAPIPPNGRSDKKRYTTLRNKLVELNQNIHILALNQERGEGDWPRAFMRAAEIVNEEAKKDGQNERHVPNHVLARIGKPGELALVRRELAAERRQEGIKKAHGAEEGSHVQALIRRDSGDKARSR